MSRFLCAELLHKLQSNFNATRRFWRLVSALAVITPLFLMSLSPAALAAPAQATGRQQLFASAAREFGVPENLLLALSYNQSRWVVNPGMSGDGGYGLMDLRTQVGATVSGRDGKVVTPPEQPASYYTLNQAAGLLHLSQKTLETNNLQNVRGGAAVLAADARALHGGRLPGGINGWFGAVAKFSGATTQADASTFAHDVFATMQAGVASTTTTDGQTLVLPAQKGLQLNQSVAALGLQSALKTPANLPGQNPECPKSLTCNFIPAAYAADSPTDPTNYGNFDYAHRPSDMTIKYIYIHDTEGSYDSTINAFQNPAFYASAQYVVRSSDGMITQMVPNEDVSWGVADWYNNMHGINIENEGFAAQGATWYTPVMYQHVATLVRWLAAKYHIPLDRQHILGHDNILTVPTATLQIQHWDPGPFWNWNYFMALVHSQTPVQAASAWTPPTSVLPLKVGDVVKISPNFATNKPVVTDCQTGTCVTLPKQGANFVYLHNQPSNNAPLLSDPYVHPDNSPGTTEDSDWGDKAPSGFQYVVAGIQGNWVGIWYAGTIGWFYNPPGQGQVAYQSFSRTLTPRPGLSSVPVYGVAFPEASAYPSVIPVAGFDQLYTMAAGQHYTTTGENLPTDYFYDATVNYSLPDDHAVVVGHQKYYQIAINHRIGYVKAADVVFDTPTRGL